MVVCCCHISSYCHVPHDTNDYCDSLLNGDESTVEKQLPRKFFFFKKTIKTSGVLVAS